MLDLEVIRGQLDEIDNEIVTLFEKRMQLCKDVAKFKIETGKQVLDRKREQSKLKVLKDQVHGDLNRSGVEDVFKQIMAVSRKLQYQILAEHNMLDAIHFQEIDQIKKTDVTVVYQGVSGAYSQSAMFQYFGKQIKHYSVHTWDDAMQGVSSGRADYAVLPIENSSAGMVGDVCDLLVKYDNTIVDECYLKVEHALMGLQDASIEQIQTVYSHPQGFMQCADYLEAHKEWETISLNNTALSAQTVLEQNDPSKAAIASELAAELYGLKVLEHGVNDEKDNTTRFLVIASKKIYRKDAKKLSICLEIAHESGALYQTLSHIIYNDLNMTKIESRPIPDKAWEYRFFIDMEGNLSDSSVQNALRGMKEEVMSLKILGNY